MEISRIYIGHVIGGSFGLAFILINGAWLPARGRSILSIIGILAFVVVLVAYFADQRHRGTTSRSPMRPDGRYRLILGIEVILLFGGLAVVRAVEPAAVLGWIALVVGAHFIPLAGLLDKGRSELIAIGTTMIILGLTGLALAFATQDRELVAFVAGVGSGAVLLGSAVFAAARTIAGYRSRA